MDGIKTNIREYCEEMGVIIAQHDGTPIYDYKTYEAVLHCPQAKERWVIVALNEGGYNSTEVDLVDVIEWVKQNKPELLK